MYRNPASTSAGLKAYSFRSKQLKSPFTFSGTGYQGALSQKSLRMVGHGCLANRAANVQIRCLKTTLRKEKACIFLLPDESVYILCLWLLFFIQNRSRKHRGEVHEYNKWRYMKKKKGDFFVFVRLCVSARLQGQRCAPKCFCCSGSCVV